MSVQVEQQSAPGFKDPNKTLSGPIVGLIYPPPEVRNIVDKTANFVARNGPEFESRIQQSEKGNKKFTFLNSGDPYHLYYQFKVREFREGVATKEIGVLPGLQKLSVSNAAQQKQQELLKQATEAQFVPREPPVEFEFVADPPSISALDLDVVKLTAQFVARNGRQFLTNLMNREQRNFQFDFLRPQHALFQYFTKLLEQYTKILIPPKELLPKLKHECETGRDGQAQILEQVKYRANWQKHQDAARRREEEMIERERVAYAQIDWHDFVVVEIVDYQPYETGNFPAPTTPDEVGARVLMEQRLQEDDDDIEMQIESDEEIDQQAPNSIKTSIMENRIRDNIQVQDMDETNSDDEGSTQPTVTPLMPPTHDKVIVKKYDPKQVQKIGKPMPASEEYLISPITGEKIPASKVAEHMRIGLLDPRWVEQRDKLIEKVREETVFAPGSDIEASLKQLAERRTDIFGVGDEEAAIGKKLGEEEPRKDDRVTWDGHTSSVEAATRAAARNISLEDQIHQIHKQKGLLQDEEKEKIGPKPAISAPPKPSLHPPMNLPGQISHHSAPPMPPPQMMINQMNQMRGQQVPPMRPPTMLPPPGFPGFHPGHPGHPGMPPMAPAAPPVMPEPINEDEPPNKRPRQEDHLIPEDVFMQSHKGPVSIQVQCPTVTDKPEWKLSGQLVTITIALDDTIQKLKQKVQGETDMPPAKQKISHDGIFFKDSNTVAYYNLVSGATVHLQVKERGGRKK